MARRQDRGVHRDDPWQHDRERRRRVLHGHDGPPAQPNLERGDYPGHEWAHERTGGRGRGDARAWERSPRSPEPPRYGWGSAWESARADDDGRRYRGRGGDAYDYDEPWHSERYVAGDEPFPPGRDSYDDRHDERDSPGDFGERSYAGYGDWSSRVRDDRGPEEPRGLEGRGDDRRAAPDPRRERHARTSAERWGLGRSGARDAWGADLRGAVEARAGRYAGRGPRGYRRSDERIREEVCDVLLDAGHVDASQLEVSVQDGEVTLEGNVSDRRMKRDAEDLAETVPGVQQVHNRLRIDTAGITGAEDANGRPVR